MTARLLAAVALACSLAPALAADPAAASVPAAAATAASVPAASVPAASVPAASVPAAPVALASTPAAAAAQAGSVQAAPAATLPTPAAAQAAPGPMTGPSAGNLLQTIFALTLVLALLGGMVWFMKRYGPQSAAGAAQIRTVGALSLGGRERIIVVEVGDQWIVVGASPGRVNALATMPKRDAPPGGPALLADGPASGSFAEWLKQTIDKRNGR